MFKFAKMEYIRNLIKKYKSRLQLSDEEIQFLFKEFLQIFTRNRGPATVPIDAQRCIVEAIRNLENSQNHSSQNEKDLMLCSIFKVLVQYIDCIPHSECNPESNSDSIIDSMKIDPTEKEQYMKACQLLMRLYNHHHIHKKLLPKTMVITTEYLTIRVHLSLSNRKIYSDISLTYMTHRLLVWELQSFPMIAEHIELERCDNCEIFRKDNLVSFEDLVKHVAQRGIYCKCWEKFAQRNPTRPIPCSVIDCGTPCDFCEKYKMMQLTEMFRALNDSFKNGSLNSDIYNELFSHLCKILEGTVLMKEFVQKLLSHQEAIGPQLFQLFFELIQKLRKFIQDNPCRANPDFLSTLDLRSLTGAEYTEYMDELRVGQDQFQERVPTLGFCCCPEIVAKAQLEARRKEKKEAQEKRYDERRRQSSMYW